VHGHERATVRTWKKHARRGAGPVPDIAKGIGILLVVLAHTIVPELRARYADLYAFWETIYAFHMSVFSSSAVTCSSAG
jgi:uncharacterized membrane protein YcfT